MNLFMEWTFIEVIFYAIVRTAAGGLVVYMCKELLDDKIYKSTFYRDLITLTFWLIMAPYYVAKLIVFTYIKTEK